MIEYFKESKLISNHKNYMEKEGRYKFFEMARNLLSRGYQTEGRLLLLFGWNSAYLSKLAGKFRLEKFEEALERCKPYFDKLIGESLQGIRLEDYEADIKYIYGTLSKFDEIKSTGASKLMCLENPNLFVMWDNGIREDVYKIKGKAQEEDYFHFLEIIKEKARYIVWTPQKCDNITLAKAIDEFNYIKATEEQEKKRKAKSGQ